MQPGHRTLKLQFEYHLDTKNILKFSSSVNHKEMSITDHWREKKCGPDHCLKPQGDLSFVVILHSRARVMTSGQTADTNLNP